MDNLIKKARSGRTNALEQRLGLLRRDNSLEVQSVHFKTSRRSDPIGFISTRTQAQHSAWLH